MPIYGEGEKENQRIRDDVRKTREEHDQAVKEAVTVLKKDIPPFLAIALASRIVGREEAEELYKVVSKNKPQGS